jgi:hypothetical protein
MFAVLLSLVDAAQWLHQLGRVRARVVVGVAVGGPVVLGAIAWVLIRAGIL